MSTSIRCASCDRQIVNREVDSSDIRECPLIGSVRGCLNEVFCGHCAKNLNEFGLFPEEQAEIEYETENQ